MPFMLAAMNVIVHFITHEGDGSTVRLGSLTSGKSVDAVSLYMNCDCLGVTLYSLRIMLVLGLGWLGSSDCLISGFRSALRPGRVC